MITVGEQVLTFYKSCGEIAYCLIKIKELFELNNNYLYLTPILIEPYPYLTLSA